MPIKGLTDRGLSFPQIGNIRKGAKKQPDRPGTDLPYFRVDFDEREVKAIDRFNALYPNGKPTDITIILPFDQIERVWNPWREAYVAGALLHRCDGEIVNYAINSATGEVVIKNGLDANSHPVKCNLQNDPDKRKRCKPTGRLHVIIPELERLAYLVVHTTSIHDIANISDQLAAIRDMNGGHIAGIPLVLRRRPVEISTPSGENGRRARRVKYLISIEADPEWVAAKIGQMKQAALPAPSARVEIKSQPGLEWSNDFDEDEDDAEVVEGEFIPTDEAPIEQAQPPQPDLIKVKLASIKFNGMTPDQWHGKAEKFIKANPNWQTKDGKVDYNHIRASAGRVGFVDITGANVDKMFAAIVAAHESK